MRLATLAIAFILALFCFIAPAQAARPDAVTQLLETRNCPGCDLHNTDLKNADLRGVNLSKANLRNADLSGANMMAVNLQDADLRGANLRDADLLAVNLVGANLKGAQLNQMSFDSARVCHTVTPGGKTANRDC